MASRVDKTREAIIQLERERQERRDFAAETKKKKTLEARDLQERGKIGDSDFVSMIERFRENFPVSQGGASSSTPRKQHQQQQQQLSMLDSPNLFQNKINVAVRKRPTSEREIVLQDHDSVTCSDPLVYVHSCKLKVDGITKVLENTRFEFDFAFDSDVSNEDIYERTTLPLVRWAALERGRSTVFAYGQTGSGKTFTMEGLQQRVARDLFALLEHENVRVMCSNFELYGTQCLDLLNDQRVLPIREDEKNCVHIVGLKEEEAQSEEELLAILARGSANRTTRATEMNSDSSRSHSIFQINLSKGGGTLLLVDLAGSERGQDTKHHDATRRSESAAINTSLLSLKECIRALETGGASTHVPYRQSKLTMVLKDSFNSNAKSKTLMIACVSPAASSADHTLNTLRYADRVKEKKAGRPSILPGASTGNSTTSSATTGPRPSSARVSLGGSKLAAPRAVSQQTSSAMPPPPPPPPPPMMQAPPAAAAAAAPAALPSRLSMMRSVPSAAAATVAPSVTRPAALARAGPPPPQQQPPLPPASVERKPMQQRELAETPKAAKLSSFASRLAADAVSPVKTDGGMVKTSVAALLDEEDALLSAYRDAVQENFHLLAEENNILTQLSEQVEYDVFASTEELRILLEHKLMLFGDLHQRLVRFQTNVRQGDA